MSNDKNSTIILFRDRLVLFILAVITIISALAWNDYTRLVLRERIVDADIIRAHLIYAVIMTGILVLSIALFAFLFRTIPGL